MKTTNHLGQSISLGLLLVLVSVSLVGLMAMHSGAL